MMSPNHSTAYCIHINRRLATMTSLDPSHNPFRTPSGRHAQAVHTSAPGPAASSSKQQQSGGGAGKFPDSLPSDDDVDDHAERPAWMRRAQDEGRSRVQRGMVPVPDLRFEQVSKW